MMKLSSTLLVALLASSQASYLRPITEPSRGLLEAVDGEDKQVVAAAAAPLAPAGAALPAAGVTKKVPKVDEEEETEETEEEEVAEEGEEEEEEETEDNVVGVEDPDTDLPQYNPDCDPTTLPQATHIANEPTCTATLPEFYKSTTAEAFTKKKTDQQTKIMDGLCKTKCGDHYTSYLSAMLAQDAKCGRDTEVVKEIEEEYVSDVVFGGLVVEVGAAEGMYKPAPEFPGLMLGCTKDTKDGKYCAVKKASRDKKSCTEFYHSCCYGEYIAKVKNADNLVANIEKMCPGSKSYATKRCAAPPTPKGPAGKGKGK